MSRATAPVSVVILAAGLSRRLGRPKQLLDWHGRPLVRAMAETAVASGVGPVAVVVGHARDAVVAALAGLAVPCVENPEYALGQGTSVATAARWATSESAEALLVVVCDQPLLQSHHIHYCVSVWQVDRPQVLIPRVAGTPTNPVMWRRDTWSALAELRGEQGGRVLFQGGQVTPTWHDLDAPELLLDVDDETDYQRVLEYDASSNRRND